MDMILFENDEEGLFIKRPNRFIIHADLNGYQVICHCPNTGRMSELLTPGVKLILEKSNNPARKTLYSVVAVYKGDLIVPIASVRANQVAAQIIIPGLFKDNEVRSEVTYKKSRFDFFVKDDEKETFIEVKSCTLFIGDRAIFPDAPTTRGVKHLNELEDAVNTGYKGMVIFVTFNPSSTSFSPNNVTDPKFAETLKRVGECIDVIPYRVSVNRNGVISVPKNPILPIKYKDLTGIISTSVKPPRISH